MTDGLMPVSFIISRPNRNEYAIDSCAALIEMALTVNVEVQSHARRLRYHCSGASVRPRCRREG
ncbi:MAG: hypothetical protein MZV63_52425 [Marinilabiliales bacterium]|nr:hypothetical protein [Marinilabiliales bacterium]